MKKLALTLTVTLACVAAFAQGKVRLINDSLHLVYFTTDANAVLAGNTAGASVDSATGQTLTAALFGGTTSASMSLQGTATFVSGIDGTISSTPIISTLPASTAAFFQVRVYTTTAGSYDAAAAGKGLYYGESVVFNTTPNGGTQYSSIVTSISPSFSTWAAGTQDLSASSAYGAGAKGAISIQVNPVPEPTSLALLGLGAASLMIFRRRK